MMIGVVRMDADARPDIGVRLSRGKHLVPLAFARSDVEHRGDAPLPRARQHLVLLLGKPLVIEVTMRIDEHYVSPSPSSSGSSRRGKIGRSEARRVGKECVSKCRSWGSGYH